MREQRSREGYHDPTAGLAGAAPARSALTLRLVLAVIGLVACGAGCVAFAVVDEVVLSVIFSVLALTAAVDVVVVARRKRRGEPG